MKCSIIISVYKDTDSLDLILESLSKQTVVPDEVIISEDGNSVEMSEYVSIAKNRYNKLDITHLFQEDIGWRKNIALNRAIVASKYEYLIFIDGDCVPYSTFVEGHMKNSEKNIVLCGKRIELGSKFTEKVKQKEIKVSDIEKNFLKFLPQLLKDNTKHLEDGFILNRNNFITKILHKRYVRHIVGCNFSCFKENFLKINGFNEDFINPAEGEDVDPSWRFREVGIELKSIRLVANIAHLYHEKRFDDDIGKINREIMDKTKIENVFYCKNGIEKL
ncbi:glycosyltransferase [Arcobacter cloacae]|uniref:Glycosyl transferase family 2 n=1 Tax=Arcobacter cloacae TaxID=1054034 RepID=A0A6M8NGU5_9BACT|nr:glycosyltransferase [Arcobacter cloacae]QKF90555.1 glycosyltransferase, family 2 [Arcobacter cloacae]RXI37900.1 glycosyl transferase family 2 [Arcobacter cloacae]